MPTITQLPVATLVTAADEIPISQNGSTCAISVGALLASTQASIVIDSPSLLGRTSLGSGSPEQVTAGPGLALNAGTLVANGLDHASFPSTATLMADAALVVSEQGTPMLMPATLLRGLFTAGQNVTISDAGLISAVSGAGSANGNVGLGSAIASLSVLGSLTAQDLVAASHNGEDYAISYANLLNGVTIDQAAIAGPAADTDTLWVAQSSNVMARQALGTIWTWIAGKLPTFQNPVLEITTNTSLNSASHNARLLVCSQPVTLAPASASMGNGFQCLVLNASSGIITLGSGFVTSSGSMALQPWQSASIVCASYSKGTIVFASMPVVSTTTATTPSVPGQVSSLMAATTTTTSITLTWQAPGSGAAVSSYLVQYRVTGTTAWSVSPPIGGATTYTVSSLQSGTSYDFTVQAVSGSTSGSPSSVLTSSTANSTTPAALPIVTNILGTAVSGSSIQLSWTAGGGAATSYTVQYSVSGTSNWNTVSGITGTITTISGLQASTSYQFTVAGVGASGTGPTAGAISVTTLQASQSVTSITWNLQPSGSYVHGSGSIAVNVSAAPISAPVQFGISSSNTLPPSSWTPGGAFNNLWGAYLATPANAGTYYIWAEGLDGSALTVCPTSVQVT